ncbi:hypothetical protein [Paracidovorax avenae]|uniref:hypothetical protein n=1 Tax=Paracidovorax avenae TaxID=80867 RepID=UPI0012601CE8|nr:hypothetical protein [Paracidovorax avenae]
MDTQTLLAEIDARELTYEAPPLFAWETGIASTDEEVASLMYRGGRFPPQMSTRRTPPEDTRPEKTYWDHVKNEMRLFLCTDEKKYKALWKQIEAIQKKSTTAIVGVIATFLGSSLGAPATILAGFVAVCLYAALKVGKEAYCGYSSNEV